MSESRAKSKASRYRRSEAIAKWATRAVYALVALLLIGWELQEQAHILSDSRCDLRSSPQTESPLMDPAYNFILAHSTPAESSLVSVVAIESSLQAIQSNVCLARAFTADLIRMVAAQQPAVIAIDKYYLVASCPAEDPNTARLKAAITALKVPLVVGESTHAPADAGSTACLVVTPQLDLGAKVRHGLTRLNQEVLELPVSWPMLASDKAEPSDPVVTEQSFSLVTATEANTALKLGVDLSSVSNSSYQPVANLTGPLQRQTATNLMCSIDKQEARRDGLDCSPPITGYDLKGKVVVIGAESDADYPSVLGAGMYGFELQSRYVAALLSGSYLRQMSPLFSLLLISLYFLVSELLIPYMHIHRRPIRPLFHIEWPLLWTAGVFFATIMLGILIPLRLHCFPPLPMLLGISGILIPRLLIEGWAILNEDEDPGGGELA